jgi:hypothetical protein
LDCSFDDVLEPWRLLIEWEVTTATQVLRIFQMNPQCWGAEDSVTFTKDGLGWIVVQLLDVTSMGTLIV